MQNDKLQQDDIVHLATPLLDEINSPEDVRNLDAGQLSSLAKEVRADIIKIVSKTGGHLGASLGVVELTIALHYVFNTPDDRLIWDVGHQCYGHKLLCGRRTRLHTLRQKNGLSGFTKRSESIYDAFGTAHSSTSISAALGMSTARDLDQKNHCVVAVIGDGAMSAGMAFEALNNAGAMKSPLIVILNDNDMSIDRPVGALSTYLARLLSSKPYLSLRSIGKQLVHMLPTTIEKAARGAEELARDLVTGRTIFTDMGFYYIGPVDGHNLEHLVPVLQNLRDCKYTKPILLHVVTKKGHGYLPAEKSDDKYHGVSKFNIATGAMIKSTSNMPTYTNVFANHLCSLAHQDNHIAAITAAMPSGTGLKIFEQQFPERFFDVGIAEQHAVTFAAGMSCEGWKPFVAIYSTFLQRAYDQIVHDVAIQKLPVRFAIDRAGLVGADGATHAGSYDIGMLINLPNFVVMAPSDEYELKRMMTTAALYNEGPIAFRYPRGEGTGIVFDGPIEPIEIGKAAIIEQGSRVAILNFGTRLEALKEAAQLIAHCGFSPTIIDMRFAKPLDGNMIKQCADSHEWIVTIEEGASGGFSAAVMCYLAKHMLLNKTKFMPLFFPDYFIEHATSEAQYEEVKLDKVSIAERIIKMVGYDNSDVLAGV